MPYKATVRNAWEVAGKHFDLHLYLGMVCLSHDGDYKLSKSLIGGGKVGGWWWVG